MSSSCLYPVEGPAMRGGGVLEGVGNARETVVKNLCKSLRDKASAAVL